MMRRIGRELNDSSPINSLTKGWPARMPESIRIVDPELPQSSAVDGAALFRTYCATCHGAAGRGDGAMAGQLRRMPPDLTTFATRNGGVFPAERVRQVIDGTGIAAHGDREMPVWGRTFMRSSKGDADAQVKARIDALVRFLQSIQERKAE